MAQASPLGALRLKLGGVVFLQWGVDLAAVNPDAPSPNGANRFDLTRAHFDVEPQIGDKISLRLTSDLTRVSGTEGNLDGSLALRMKYAYAQFADVLPGMAIKAGMQQTAFIGFEDALWSYRVLGPSGLELFTGASSSDLGVGLLGKNFDGVLDWQALVMNGEGYTKPERAEAFAAKYKDVSGRVTVAPFARAQGHALEGLKLTLFGQYGISESVGDDHLERARALATLSYQRRGLLLSAGGGPIWDGALDVGEVVRRDGLLLTTFGTLDLPYSLRLLARFDRFDPDLDASASDGRPEDGQGVRSRLITGLAYIFNAQLQIIADYQRFDSEAPRNAPPGAVGQAAFLHLEAKY